MANLVKKAEYGIRKTILIAPELAMAIPVQVADTGIVADENGKKIVKAGTAVAGSENVLLSRDTAVAKADDATAQGIILHDVDVTEGTANGTMLVSGYVDVLKLEEDAIPSATAQGALTKITFMKGV